MPNPWFRLYSEIIDNEKIRLLAFEDRWHFVALCCLKNTEYLDKVQDGLFRRGLEVKLGVTGVDLDNLKARLIEVNLIDDEWQPVGWDERQFKSDSSKERVRKYREKLKKEGVKRDCNVTVTAQEAETEEETDTEEEHVGGNPSGCPRACPHKQIVSLYHELLPELTQHRTWEGKRRTHLQARWRAKTKYQNLGWWENFFRAVSASDFLMGRIPGKDWKADLEWMVKPDNFAKIIDGKYQ